MYESQKWKKTGVKGLQCRCGSVFLFRKRVNNILYRLYLGRLPIVDAELIASVLDLSHPQKWKYLLECTKKFCEWERSATY